MLFGWAPAFSRPTDNAIEKQPARAAPISSSGLLPVCPSNRVPMVNGTSFEFAGFIVPLPALRVPFHVAFAVLFDML
jgi:hypothetical protein